MKQTQLKRLLSFILCLVLIAAMALFANGCNENENLPADTGTGTAEGETEAPAPTVTTLGTGQTTFYFNVIDKDGNETKFEIHTDKTVVGDALMELGLIEGDEGPYGLYVKKVNGITADYDTDGTYWAFYIGDDYGMTGVDMTNIEPGATYAFKVSK